MKHESKYGLNEICEYGEDLYTKSKQKQPDLFLKVIGIIFTVGGTTEYLCEYTDMTGQIHKQYFAESQLEGDPDFNQDAGKYMESES
jgi:hypothetical protein